MEISSDGMGIMVVVLGVMLVVAGLAIAVVLVKQKAWWERLVMGMLAMDMSEFAPEGMRAMVPMFQQMVLELLKKVFNYLTICALAGGAGVTLLGAVLVVIGIYIMS